MKQKLPRKDPKINAKLALKKKQKLIKNDPKLPQKDPIGLKKAKTDQK